VYAVVNKKNHLQQGCTEALRADIATNQIVTILNVVHPPALSDRDNLPSENSVMRDVVDIDKHVEDQSNVLLPILATESNQSSGTAVTDVTEYLADIAAVDTATVNDENLTGKSSAIKKSIRANPNVIKTVDSESVTCEPVQNTLSKDLSEVKDTSTFINDTILTSTAFIHDTILTDTAFIQQEFSNSESITNTEANDDSVGKVFKLKDKVRNSILLFEHMSSPANDANLVDKHLDEDETHLAVASPSDIPVLSHHSDDENPSHRNRTDSEGNQTVVVDGNDNLSKVKDLVENSSPLQQLVNNEGVEPSPASSRLSVHVDAKVC